MVLLGETGKEDAQTRRGDVNAGLKMAISGGCEHADGMLMNEWTPRALIYSDPS